MRMLFRLTILGLAVYGGKTLYERYGRDVREAVASHDSQSTDRFGSGSSTTSGDFPRSTSTASTSY